MDLGLSGKVALITGGSEGIGKATATRMAAEGAKVVICARSTDVLRDAASDIGRETGAEVTAVPADVTEPAQLAAVFDHILATYGRIDVLVNNAGQGANRPFPDLTDGLWRDDLDLKVVAMVRGCRLAIPHMRKQGGGRIVNVTNVDGKTPGLNSLPASVSRAAGIALTKALSKEYAQDNILVNTVCIGFVRSAQNDRRARTLIAATPGVTLDQWYAEAGKGVPLGRVGASEEAGDVIAFLASARASYVTGVAVNIDGGACAVV